ncbi:hypothetical protein DH2020_024364 [Rehmannia glutinosa]|uniref:DUF4283 domain-containing protein n=1 Tax=Rehmannia glutinosa TaxID=99300 RepID=A0ABR0W5J2_REHGL
METNLANLSLFDDEDDEFVFENNNHKEANFDPTLCLVGKFISERSVNFNITKHRLTAIWRPVKGMSVKDIGDQRFLFQFYHKLDLQRILDGGPWSFDNLMLMLAQLYPSVVPMTIPMHSLLFWVQIFNLPIGCLNENVGRQLGNFIGSFVEYDPKNSSSVWRSFMRIRVNVDIRVPLKRFKKVKLQGGEWSVVEFKSERLGSFCFICGMLTHTERFCEKRFSWPDGEPPKEWGPNLRGVTRKSTENSGDKWLIEVDDNMKEIRPPKGPPANQCFQFSSGKNDEPGSSSGRSSKFRRSLHGIVVREGSGNSNLQLHTVTKNFLGIETNQQEIRGQNLLPMAVTNNYINNPDDENFEIMEERKRKRVITNEETNIQNPLSNALAPTTSNSPSSELSKCHKEMEYLRNFEDSISVERYKNTRARDPNDFFIRTPQVEGLEDISVNELFIPDTYEWDLNVIEELFDRRDTYQILQIPLCETDEEDQKIWSFSKTGVYTVKTGYRSNEFMCRLGMIVWNIWKQRNGKLWKNTQLNAKLTVKNAWAYLDVWTAAQQARVYQLSSIRGGCKGWHLPPAGTVKCNIDAAFFKEQNSYGIGMVIFELDVKGVVDAIRNHENARTEFGRQIRASQLRLVSEPKFSVQYVCRQVNIVAHVLARASYSYASPTTWVEPPSVVHTILQAAGQQSVAPCQDLEARRPLPGRKLKPPLTASPGYGRHASIGPGAVRCASFLVVVHWREVGGGLRCKLPI